MKNWFWRDGRLGWPFVAAVVFLSVSLIALDLVWRFMQIAIEDLLLYAMLAEAGAALAIVLAYRILRTPSDNKP